MKIKEVQTRDQGFAHGLYSRVRELEKGEEIPMGATVVPDDTPLSDWKPEEDR